MVAFSVNPFRPMRRRQRFYQGLCPACGYDFRANRALCTECGQAIPSEEDIERERTSLGRLAIFLLWQAEHPKRSINILIALLIPIISGIVIILETIADFIWPSIPFARARFWDQFLNGMMILASVLIGLVLFNIYALMVRNWQDRVDRHSNTLRVNRGAQLQSGTSAAESQPD
jgi:hypothetical protein